MKADRFLSAQFTIWALSAALAILSPIANAQRSKSDRDFLERAQELRLKAKETLFNERANTSSPVVRIPPKYPWKTSIVTTVFCIGDRHGRSIASAWDPNWQTHYGGFDDPNPKHRTKFIPSAFVPRLNPFYVALPYNDINEKGTKPEAAKVIPWFRAAFVRDRVSVCQNRWVAIRRNNRIAYAQWSDCGPFVSDHWEYVFGAERPKSNAEQGAGIRVSPAVRDYLGLSNADVTDWRFADISDVPQGPWADYGTNNPLAVPK
jgi:hypothetical protein